MRRLSDKVVTLLMKLMDRGENSGDLAKILRKHRWELGKALVASVSDWDKYSHLFSGDTEVRYESIRLEMLSFVDYLARFFENDDATFIDLYLGEKLKQCYDPRDSPENSIDRKKRITDKDRAIFISELKAVLKPSQLERLMATLEDIQQIVTSPGRIRAKVLFVGDCLHLDVISFLTAPLLRLGI